MVLHRIPVVPFPLNWRVFNEMFTFLFSKILGAILSFHSYVGLFYVSIPSSLFTCTLWLMSLNILLKLNFREPPRITCKYLILR